MFALYCHVTNPHHTQQLKTADTSQLPISVGQGSGRSPAAFSAQPPSPAAVELPARPGSHPKTQPGKDLLPTSHGWWDSVPCKVVGLRASVPC